MAPTFDQSCGTTYPVEVTSTCDCAGEIIATSVTATASLNTRGPSLSVTQVPAAPSAASTSRMVNALRPGEAPGG